GWGMVGGLGTGSTAVWAVRRIGARLADGTLHDVVGVPTARQTAEEARRGGVPPLDDDVPWEIDLTIDGADEVDPALNLGNGGRGRLLREKLVAQARAREVIVVDGSKPSPLLGTKHVLPIETFSFGLATTMAWLATNGARCVLRGGAADPYRTDQGNVIVDADFGPIPDPAALSARLADHAGIAEHGLFISLTDTLVVAGADGITIQQRSDARKGS